MFITTPPYCLLFISKQSCDLFLFSFFSGPPGTFSSKQVLAPPRFSPQPLRATPWQLARCTPPPPDHCPGTRCPVLLLSSRSPPSIVHGGKESSFSLMEKDVSVLYDLWTSSCCRWLKEQVHIFRLTNTLSRSSHLPFIGIIHLDCHRLWTGTFIRVPYDTEY